MYAVQCMHVQINTHMPVLTCLLCVAGHKPGTCTLTHTLTDAPTCTNYKHACSCCNIPLDECRIKGWD